MSRTLKEGKTDNYRRRTRAFGSDEFSVRARYTWGSTEKILRRNRKTWLRLGNKRRRRNDEIIVDAQIADELTL